MLYRGKYSKNNPDYTERFFSDILEGQDFDIICLKKSTIDAFALYEIRSGIMQVSCVGHDTSLPKNINLYRQISALIFDCSIKNNYLLNCSSGALSFKQQRGGQITHEYFGVYSKHLSLFRRLTWSLYGFVMNHTFPMVEDFIVSALNKVND